MVKEARVRVQYCTCINQPRTDLEPISNRSRVNPTIICSTIVLPFALSTASDGEKRFEEPDTLDSQTDDDSIRLKHVT